MVYARVSKTRDVKVLRVRVSPQAPATHNFQNHKH
ncbi:MAG: hypothetical protein ACD_40C00251G0007, partial [uncultured bacterium]